MQFRSYSSHPSPLSNTPISDVKGTVKQLPAATRGLWAAYCRRYMLGPTRNFMPFVHVMLVAGGFGYALEYSHLSKKLA